LLQLVPHALQHYQGSVMQLAQLSCCCCRASQPAANHFTIQVIPEGGHFTLEWV
jgi:hypothetical protein